MSYTLFPYQQTNIFEFRNRYGNLLYFLYRRNGRSYGDWIDLVVSGGIGTTGFEIRYNLITSFAVWSPDTKSHSFLSAHFSNYLHNDPGRGGRFQNYKDRVGGALYFSPPRSANEYRQGKEGWFQDIERNTIFDPAESPLAFSQASKLSARRIDDDPRPDPNRPTQIVIPEPVVPDEPELEEVPVPVPVPGDGVIEELALDRIVYDYGDVRLGAPDNVGFITQRFSVGFSPEGSWVRQTTIQVPNGNTSLEVLSLLYADPSPNNTSSDFWVVIHSEFYVPDENLYPNGLSYPARPGNWILEFTHLATGQTFRGLTRDGSIFQSPPQWSQLNPQSDFSISFGNLGFLIPRSTINNSDRRWSVKLYVDLPLRANADLIYTTGIRYDRSVNLFLSLEGQDDLAPSPVFDSGDRTLDVERETRTTRTYQIAADHFAVEDINIASEFGLEEKIVEGNFLVPISRDFEGAINEYRNDVPNGRRKNIIAPEKIIRLGHEFRQLLLNAMEFLNWRSLIRQKITFRVENTDLPELGDIVELDVDLSGEKLSTLFPTQNKVGVVDGITYHQDYADISILV